MRTFIKLCLVGVALTGCARVKVSNDIKVQVPEGSMAVLKKVAHEIADRAGLKIERIRFDTVGHPCDTAVAIIEFEKQNAGQDVYLFPSQILRNTHWPGRYTTRTSVAEYPQKLGPASTKWVTDGEVHRRRKLRLRVAGAGDILVHIGDQIRSDVARTYLEKFVRWAGEHPEHFREKLGAMSRLVHDVQKGEVTIFFDSKLTGRGYVFDVSEGGFVWKEGYRVWMSRARPANGLPSA